MRIVLAALLIAGTAQAQTLEATNAIPFTVSVTAIEQPEGFDATRIAIRVTNGDTEIASASVACTITDADGSTTEAEGRVLNVEPNSIRDAAVVFQPMVKSDAVSCRVTGFAER